jgi:hypothetical protein
VNAKILNSKQPLTKLALVWDLVLEIWNLMANYSIPSFSNSLIRIPKSEI